ncbi:MAG: PepSY domain-containing protein [Hyphomicrobiaceae bacterium]
MLISFTRRKLMFGLLAAAVAGWSEHAAGQPRRRPIRPRLPGGSARRRLRRFRRTRRRAIERFRKREGPIAVDEARAAVERGDVQPLTEVFRMVAQRGRAEVLDVDLFKRGHGWVYALRVLGPRGRVRDVVLDAKTLELIELD